MAHAIDNQCWIVASDIIIEENAYETYSGYASIVNSKQEVVAKSELSK